MTKKGRREAKVVTQKGSPVVRYRCPFPDCPRTFRQLEGQLPLCTEHRRFVADLVYAINNLGPGEEDKTEEEAGPKILVPKPGMEKQAIEEALKKARG